MYNARRNLLDISKKLTQLKKLKYFSINGIPLFDNENDLKWSFVIWAHNGGNGIIQRRFLTFIGSLRKKILAPVNMCKRTCGCQSPKSQNNKCTKRCLDKCKFKFKSLTTSDLHREFALFAKEQGITNAEEVSDFMNKIKTQLLDLSNQRSLRSALKRFHKNKPYDEDKMQELIGSTQKHCPTNINQIFDYD